MKWMLSTLTVLALALAAPAGDELSGKLTVFHAGSLAVPFREIAKAFNRIHPQVTVQLEAAGSRACARKISELKQPCDVMASADFAVIDALLIPDHAEWNIKLATNEMALVYHEGSRRAAAITPENWPEILLAPNVAFGRSDPNSDPCGYRTVLTMKLAETYYQRPGLAEKLLAKDRNCIRPKETDLLALLESNTIDYIFLYRSVAQQHGLKFVPLPDEINLRRTDLSDLYEQVSVQISGKTPGTFITRKGAPMVYGITIPKSAPNPKAALAFVTFVLSQDQGMAILERLGQQSAVPAKTSTYDKIPAQLKAFATK